ncbi:unnamed protein product [Kluyveromyces dobzhanskii CBS 2104]|uniref:WGS project CCBQ000000000 data, contig 00010 n=1 Tax=Kluyveromyces dobzhanskii CBS 2104 TaxID=1427455 RepID=A0A0A8LD50_9SACH|nr:unnamed protein product [Kluyveromyces dobzhanskii CBS 2104]
MSAVKVSPLKLERGHARRAGCIEEVLLMQHRQKIYSNFAVYGKLKTAASDLELSHALHGLFMRYPILASTIMPDHWEDRETFYQSEEFYSQIGMAEDYMYVLDQLKFEDIIINHQPEHAEYFQRILNQWIKDGYEYGSGLPGVIDGYTFACWDPTKPQFRLLLLPSEDDKELEKGTKHILFVTNHIATDGTSGANLLQDLSVELGKLFGKTLKPLDNVFCYEQQYDQLPKLPDRIEERVSYKVDLPFIGSFMLGQFGKKFLAKKWDKPITTHVGKSKTTHTSHLIRIDVPEMQKMRARVKEKLHGKATLTPFLQACWFVSCYEAGVFDNRRWNEYLVNMAVPMNSRQYLPQDEEIRDQYRYGTHVAGCNYNFLISSFDIKTNQQFWDLTAYYQNCFADIRDKNSSLKCFGLLFADFLMKSKNLDKLISDDMTNQRRAFALLSNVGFFPQTSQESNPFQLQDLVFSQTSAEMPFVFSLNCVSTDVGGMTISMSCPEKSISHQQWRKVCEVFEKNLTTL